MLLQNKVRKLILQTPSFMIYFPCFVLQLIMCFDHNTTRDTASGWVLPPRQLVPASARPRSRCWAIGNLLHTNGTSELQERAWLPFPDGCQRNRELLPRVYLCMVVCSSACWEVYMCVWAGCVTDVVHAQCHHTYDVAIQDELSLHAR